MLITTDYDWLMFELKPHAKISMESPIFIAFAGTWAFEANYKNDYPFNNDKQNTLYPIFMTKFNDIMLLRRLNWRYCWTLIPYFKYFKIRKWLNMKKKPTHTHIECSYYKILWVHLKKKYRIESKKMNFMHAETCFRKSKIL